MNQRYLFSLLTLASLNGFAQSPQKPNIVYILADDLGIGDVSCYNPAGKIKTPNIDRLTKTGVRFTDAHTSSSVCTPTRYSILTGRYNWRSKLKSSVLFGYDTALIAPNRQTVASFLQKQGYQTGVVGKWHLGWNWANIQAGRQHIDFSQPVGHSPNTNGFGYSFCIAGSLDMPPYVYVENGRPTTVPTDSCSAQTGLAMYRAGPIAPDFTHEQVLPTLTEKSVKFIQEHAGKESPFFLYFPLTAPHTPILPTPEFRGKSRVTPYADFVLMVDDAVGRITDALKAAGVYENTLVLFVSDNGFSPAADLDAQLAKGHDPCMEFRGTKADIFEAGHRVPFIVSWPDRIKQARTSTQLVCTTDLFRTIADLMNVSVADNAAEDSFSFLPELIRQRSTLPRRTAVVHHSINGSFAIRRGKWKLINCPDSGGWSSPKPGSEEARKLPPIQLYDLSADAGELSNVYKEYPAVVSELSSLLKNYVDRGRSTPGQPQSNDKAGHWPSQPVSKPDIDK